MVRASPRQRQRIVSGPPPRPVSDEQLALLRAMAPDSSLAAMAAATGLSVPKIQRTARRHAIRLRTRAEAGAARVAADPGSFARLSLAGDAARRAPVDAVLALQPARTIIASVLVGRCSKREAAKRLGIDQGTLTRRLRDGLGGEGARP